MDYGQPVQFGVFLAPDATQPNHLLELAGLADDLGFELIGIQDHPYQRRFLDTWTLLSAIAMRNKAARVFPWFATDVVPAVRDAVAKAR
jgi:alkanesulfonate monooxygenase SsuD/methylene tetrahydromethanopterin reductase-like flavin-dependent oxidoreductase (luciferase family)